MKKIRPFRLSDETVAKMDAMCGGNRTEWLERMIEGGGVVGGVVLSEQAKKKVGEVAKRMGLSEGAVVEMAVMEFAGVGERLKPTTGVHSPEREIVGDTDRRGDTTTASAGSNPAASKREVFEALKAKLGGAPKLETETYKDLSNTPCAPFDVVVEGEEHRVTQMGKRLGLFYVGGGEPAFARYLAEGELEKLWERRKK